MRHRLSLPFESWPECDRELWQAIIESTEDWVDQTRAAGWKSRTRIEAMQTYGRWLRWLLDHDRLDAEISPAHRVAPDVVSQFVNNELSRVRAGAVSNMLFYLIGILDSFAPEQDWSWLYKLRSRLKRKASREPRTRLRIVPAQSLFDLGIELMRRATESQSEEDIDIDLFLDGMLIGLLISIYLRIANFTELEHGRDLERGPKQWRLQVAGDLTKTGQADNSLLPITLTPWIDIYVNVVRPLLTVRCRISEALSRRFWIGLDGRALSGHLIRKRIKARTKEAYGFAICPHTFRKIAATTFILERPEYALHGPALLGHRSEDTIQKHYFASQQQLAIRTYHRLRHSGRADDASRVRAKGAPNRQIEALLVCAGSPPSTHRSRRPRQRD